VIIGSVDIPGLLDIAVKEYIIWYQSRVSSETFKKISRKPAMWHLKIALTSRKSTTIKVPFFADQGVKACADLAVC
jgi:hypothetical protein